MIYMVPSNLNQSGEEHLGWNPDDDTRSQLQMMTLVLPRLALLQIHLGDDITVENRHHLHRYTAKNIIEVKLLQYALLTMRKKVLNQH